MTAGGGAHFLATLNTKRQALLKFDGAATTISALTGGNIGGTLIPTAQWKSVRLPSSAADGSAMSFYGTLVPKVAGVTAATSSGIFFGSGSGFEPLVRPGQTATALGTATFASFLDPVMSPDGEAIAFSSFVKGDGVTPATNQVLWSADTNATLSVLAREGTDAAGGGTWNAFTNLAFPAADAVRSSSPRSRLAAPSRAPTTAARGRWTARARSSGCSRKGDTIDGQVLKSFTLLKPSVGSKGATHSFNANGTVAWRAVFKKGAAILKTEIPDERIVEPGPRRP